MNLVIKVILLKLLKIKIYFMQLSFFFKKEEKNDMKDINRNSFHRI